MDHEIDDARQETLELQSDGDDCVLAPGKYCICCGSCGDEEFIPPDDYDFDDDGQPSEYDEWQDYFGGDEDPPHYIDDWGDE